MQVVPAAVATAPCSIRMHAHPCERFSACCGHCGRCGQCKSIREGFTGRSSARGAGTAGRTSAGLVKVEGLPSGAEGRCRGAAGQPGRATPVRQTSRCCRCSPGRRWRAPSRSRSSACRSVPQRCRSAWPRQCARPRGAPLLAGSVPGWSRSRACPAGAGSVAVCGPCRLHAGREEPIMKNQVLQTIKNIANQLLTRSIRLAPAHHSRFRDSSQAFAAPSKSPRESTL